jgi:predicted PolB exonuclease-like 3'-5' exonuclease
MSYNLSKILYLDIETVPLSATRGDMDETLLHLYVESEERKKQKDPNYSDLLNSEFGGTGLQAEFGKVVCVSIGRFDGGTSDEHIKLHSEYSDDEPELLLNLAKIFNKYPDFLLCAHNGKNFDFPFLARRYLINDLKLPKILNTINKKPWEVPHLDTMEMWSFGARGQSVSLKLLCAVFGIPSPKDDISGADVAAVYYKEKDIKRISMYCEKDVKTLMQVFKKITSNYNAETTS